MGRLWRFVRRVLLPPAWCGLSGCSDGLPHCSISPESETVVMRSRIVCTNHRIVIYDAYWCKLCKHAIVSEHVSKHAKSGSHLILECWGCRKVKIFLDPRDPVQIFLQAKPRSPPKPCPPVGTLCCDQILLNCWSGHSKHFFLFCFFTNDPLNQVIFGLQDRDEWSRWEKRERVAVMGHCFVHQENNHF